ncbi:MAG TPA: metallophosphoesterase family protein [Thermoanaerobaculia bacterium]|nr:metallophosphoesterase family protein [Thermoanaerobaculia bacterium]
MRVGVVSDTHGILRPEVPALLAGCDAILHAGDVGHPAILTQLAAIAPVSAVRGNVDTAGTLARLPDNLAGELAGLRYRMVHRREDVGARWSAEHDLLVFGHSHRPELEWRGSCLLLNPGSCGQRRFRLPLTLALLTIRDGRLTPEILAVE